MAVNINVTKRIVKNKTGIDVSVTSFTSASSAKLVKYFHVVVISRLPFFKLPHHSESDTVQFMVCRDYSSFEKLQKDILLAFPEIKFPSLPRKYLMFMNDSDIEERMVSFDCIVKLISRHKSMFDSAPMLEFLGFDSQTDRKYYKARREYLQKMKIKTEYLNMSENNIYGLTDSDHGFFGGASNEDVPSSDDSQISHHQPFPLPVDSIFEEEEEKEYKKSTKKKSAKITIMEDDDAELFHMKRPTSPQGNHKALADVEDYSELLNVTDSLDDVLKIVKDNKKSGVKKVMAPLDPPSMGKGCDLFDMDDKAVSNMGTGDLFDMDDKAVSNMGTGDLFDMDDKAVSNMGTDDIMKYIEQNQQASNDDDLNLF